MSKKSILIVDDEPNIRRILQAALEKAGWIPTLAEDAEEAQATLEGRQFDCLLTDVTMPGRSGYELLRAVRESHPELPVVVMTAYGTIPQAVKAIRDGAFEYVTKPFDLDNLKKILASAVETTSDAKPLRRAAQAKAKRPNLIAESPAMKDVLATVEQVADSRATVLVTGESGVGKEVIARSLHELSTRSSKPYVAISCAALPETLLESELFGYEKGAFTGAQMSKVGRFEMAHTGTLFLDEIGDIPMPTQIKLLRVLQEREFERLGATKPTKVDVRLITATNRDLQQAVDDGSFRLDLMYRLQVVEVHIPPLRERQDDILPLARHFLEKYSAESDREPLKIGPDVEAMLLKYRWPGNVRELENMMERATVLSPKHVEELQISVFPPQLRQAA